MVIIKFTTFKAFGRYIFSQNDFFICWSTYQYQWSAQTILDLPGRMSSICLLFQYLRGRSPYLMIIVTHCVRFASPIELFVWPKLSIKWDSTVHTTPCILLWKLFNKGRTHFLAKFFNILHKFAKNLYMVGLILDKNIRKSSDSAPPTAVKSENVFIFSRPGGEKRAVR